MQNNSIYTIIVNDLPQTVTLKIVDVGCDLSCYYFQSDIVLPKWKGSGWDTKDGSQYFLGGTLETAEGWMNAMHAKLKN